MGVPCKIRGKLRSKALRGKEFPQKKVLSLVLCVAVMLSVMVMGAGAAFSDQDKIKNTEAVDACVALNIIGGYEDGSYHPERNIKRSEITKMICVALNGGKEPNVSTNTTPTFSDVRGTNAAWAEGYIESCVAQGIISGVGGGRFSPNGNVTGTQLAKMLLVSLGYNANTEEFVGNAWATNVNVRASQKGLYEGLESMDTSAAITRDNAAQMVWNAMNAYEVEYKTTIVTGEDGKLETIVTVQDKVVGDNDDKITLLEDKYDAKAITGTLTKVKQDNGKSTYNITIENAKYNGGTYNGGTVSYTDVSKDYSDLLYQNVRVLVKPDKNGKDAVVYGVYATGKNTVQTGLLADLKMDGTKAKLDGTKYDLANTNTVYVDGVKQSDNIKTWLTTNGEGNATYGKGSEVELLAVDGTSDYSILKVTTFEVKEITYVGSDYVTAGTKYSDDDYVISDGLKKGDYALISKGSNYADSKGRIEKATVVEGKVTSTKGSDEVMIDGTWYTMNTGVTAPKLNASAKLVLVNGYVYAVDTVTAGSSDVALVVEVGNSNTVGSKYYQARLILADGTDKVVNIEKNDGNDQALDSKNFAGYSNKLAAYDVSKDVYTLTFITTASDQKDMAGYENFYYAEDATIDGSVRTSNVKGFTGASDNTYKETVNRAYFDDNATVFVKYKNDDYKVVTGEAARKWDEITPSMVRMLTEEKSNSQYIGVAYVDLGEKNVPGGSDKTYAVALDDSYTSKIDGTTYTIVKAWNGTEETEYKYEGTLSGGIKKGSVFEYSSNGDGTVDIDKLTATTTQVKTYDKGSGEITFADTVTNLTGSNAKIDAKDTTVLFVDSDAATGETNGEIQLAPEFNGDATNHDDNVTVYVDSGDDCITLIVVDVQNKMAW
ncbi:S-layer homology domain-containing protein [Evtepia gabavorous]|uniref:S-layer homology domain-containing protein n=1 Tax=Evtepia gabavorous TaxID=2211183 RepID=UPI0023F21BB3|nr:S-layer homology domain-containing protein [Evtepia gabavorous]